MSNYFKIIEAAEGVTCTVKAVDEHGKTVALMTNVDKCKPSKQWRRKMLTNDIVVGHRLLVKERPVVYPNLITEIEILEYAEQSESLKYKTVNGGRWVSTDEYSEWEFVEDLGEIPAKEDVDN